MAEVSVMSDGGHSEGTDDNQTLIKDGNGLEKLKRHRYKLLAVGLTAVVLVSCVIALAVTHSGTSNTDQSSSANNDQPNSENQNSEVAVSGNLHKNVKERRKTLSSHPGNFNEGRQFAIAFASVFSLGSSRNVFECLVIAREQTTVTFDAQYLSLNKSVSLAPGAILTETFGYSIQTTGGIEEKAIYITATNDVIVQCAGTDHPDTDSFLALPYDDDSKEYYIAVCDNYTTSSTAYIGVVNVVATVDNTEVKITCPSGVSECPGESYTVNLQRYQTYSLYVIRYSDLTGFHINASNPVSVFTGSPNLPFYEGGSYSTYQFLILAVPPLHQLGTLHYAPETSGDPARNHRLRIIATASTNLLIPHFGVNEMLQRYQFFTQDYSYSGESVGPLEVSCSSPCLVVHCNKEHQPYTHHAYMMRVIPTEAFSDNILFSSNDYFDETYNHYLSILVNVYPVTDLYLDGNPLAGEDWTPTASGSHSGIMMNVSSGLHHLNSTSEVKFAAYSHGNGALSNRYGYGNAAGSLSLTYVEDPETDPDPDNGTTTRMLPGYRVHLYGNFSSLGGEDFTMECGSQYATELGVKANNMVPIVNGLLGGALCSNIAVGDIVVVASSNSLTTTGPNGQTWIVFVMKLDGALRFEEVHDCGAEVTTYLLDHANWGTPLLPPIGGCPVIVFNPPMFYDNGGEWICSSTLQDDQYLAATPTLPGYDFTIEGNYTTLTGENLTVDCGTRYVAEFDQQTADMFMVLNSRLGSSLCAGTTFSILSWNSVFFYQGSQGITTVTYVLKSEVNHRIEEVFDCTDEILPFVMDHVNWDLPLIPQLPGCPFLVFFEQRFWEKHQKWNCGV